MIRAIYKAAVLSLMLLTSLGAFAETVEDIVQSTISKINQRFVVSDVKESPLKGMYEVVVNDQEVVYVSEDGDFLMFGKLIHIQGDKAVDLTEESSVSLREKIIGSIDLAGAITFPSSARGQANEVIVFTDPSCAYCQAFHRNMESINAQGVTVHYLAYPRAGRSSEAGRILHDVWCSSNQKQAITDSMLQKQVGGAATMCVSPVQSHEMLARKLKVSGTPAIYDMQGNQLGGYLTADELRGALMDR